jgi:hypothetical protein
MLTLDELAKKNGTDKSSEHHNYCVKYEKYLPFNREQSIKILEIGVFRGDSLNTWKEFYPNSIVVGLDINSSCVQYQNINKNIFVEIGSQNDEDFLNKVISKWGEFDMILDDGSHVNSDIIKSFEVLFPSLKSQGVYVIEDSCTSYWSGYGGGYRKENTAIEYCKNLVDDVNFNGLFQEYIDAYARREDYLIKQCLTNNTNIRKDIESINFLNSIIILTKR